jgi:hypothetical protein
MDVLEKRRVAKQKVPKLFGSISKIFQYPKIVLTIAITLALFIVLKFSVYRNIFS